MGLLRIIKYKLKYNFLKFRVNKSYRKNKGCRFFNTTNIDRGIGKTQVLIELAKKEKGVIVCKYYNQYRHLKNRVNGKVKVKYIINFDWRNFNVDCGNKIFFDELLTANEIYKLTNYANKYNIKLFGFYNLHYL